MSGRKVTVLVASVATILSAAVVAAPVADAKAKAKAPGKVNQARVARVTTTSATLTWKNPKSKKNKKFVSTVVRVAPGTRAPATVKAGRAAGTVGKKQHAITIARLAPNTLYSVSLFSYGGKKLYSKPVTLRLHTKAKPKPKPRPKPKPKPKPVAPGKVGNVKVAIAKGVATLTWTPPGGSNFGGVVVNRATKANPGARAATPATTFPVTLPKGTNSFSDKTIEAGKTYTYSVQSRDASGKTVAATAAPAPVETDPAAKPVTAVTTTASANTITLGWQLPTDKTNYAGATIVRKSGDEAPTGPADGTVLKTVDVSATSYGDTPLAGGARYSYTVFAVNGDGIATNDATAHATGTAKYGAPKPVTDVKALVADSANITISWKSAVGDLNYTGAYIRRATGTTAPTATTGTLVADVAQPGTEVTDSGLSAGTTYTYAVFAHNGANPADVVNGPTVTATTKFATTGPVSGVTATATGAKTVKLAWANPASAGYTGVLIRRAAGAVAPTTTTGTLVEDVDAPGAAFTDTTASPETQYTYAFFAHNGATPPDYAAAAKATVTTPDVSIVPPAITGRVLRKDTGAPLAGVTVQADYENDGPHTTVATAVTKANGTYALTGLDAGALYDIDFDPSTVTGSPDGGFLSGYAGSVRAAGATVTAVPDVALERGAEIKGTVKSASPAGSLADVTVRLFEFDDDEGPYSVDATVSAKTGAYRFAGLEPGKYVVCFDGSTVAGAVGFASVCNAAKPWNGGSEVPAGATETTAKTATAAVVDQTLSTGGAISGSARSAITGAALPGVEVLVADAGTQSLSYRRDPVTTGADGAYVLKGLVPGRKYVVCFDAGQVEKDAGYFDECYKDVALSASYEIPANVTAVSVAAGSISKNVDVTLTPAGGVSGTVSGGTQASKLGDVDVRLIKSGDDEDDDFDSLTTKPDGSFVFRGLTGGSYDVCFRARYASGGTYAGGYKDLCKSVTVNAGQNTDTGATVLLKAAGLTGTVRAATGGGALAGVDVTTVTEDEDGDSSSTTTESDGTYALARVDDDVTSVCFDGADAAGGTSQFGYGKTCKPVTVIDGQLVVVDATLASAGAISGKVTAASNSEALGGIDVVVFDNDDNEVDEATTEDDGTYVVTGLEPAASAYRVCFRTHGVEGGPSATGYQAQCATNKTWDEGVPAAGAQKLSVTAAAAVQHVDAALAAGAALGGTVKSGGAALSEVAVTVFDDEALQVNGTYTADDGTWRLVGVQPGKYKVCFDADSAEGGSSPAGYLSQCYANVAWDGDIDELPTGSTTITVGTSGLFNADVTLTPAGGIAGTIRGAGGQPIEDASVEVFSSTGVSRTDSTDENGRYLVTSLAAGKYTVCVSARYAAELPTGGFTPRCFGDVTWNPGQDGPASGAAKVAVTSGAISSGKDVTLPRGGSVSGSITVTGGATPENLYVYVYDGTTFVASVGADDDGSYSVLGLPAGKYRVCARAYDEDGDFVPECYGGAVWDNENGEVPAEAAQVSVTAGADRPGVNIELDRAGSVTGKVTAAGKGTQAQVTLFDAAGDQVTSTYSDDSDGTYELVGVTPGTYAVCFTVESEGEYSSQCYANVPYSGYGAPPSSATKVVVSPGQPTSGINATLSKPGTVSGTITSAADGSGVGATVYAITGGVAIASTESDVVDGTYSLTAPKGSYSLCVDTANATYDLHGYTYGVAGRCFGDQPWDGQVGAVPGSATPVGVSSQGNTEGKDFELTAAGAITGTATSGGKPISDVYVVVFGKDKHQLRYGNDDVTNAAGKYTIAHLSPGQYYVCFVAVVGKDASTATQTGYFDSCVGASSWASGGDSFDYGKPPAGASLISVTADAATPNQNVALTKAGSISGRVTSGGKGISDEMIEVYSGTLAAPTLVTTGYSQADGSYAVTGLPSGSYFVCFTNPFWFDSTTNGFIRECNADKAWTAKTAPLPAGTSAVAVTAGSSAKVNADLAVAAKIRVTVSDQDDLPVNSVDVRVFAQDGSEVYSAGYGGDGTFDVVGLATGNYYVCFDTSFSDTIEPECYRDKAWAGGDAPLPSGLTVVPVTAGATTSIEAKLTSVR